MSNLPPPLPPLDYENLRTAVAITLAVHRGTARGPRPEDFAEARAEVATLLEPYLPNPIEIAISLANVAIMFGRQLSAEHGDTLERFLSGMLKDMGRQGPAEQ